MLGGTILKKKDYRGEKLQIIRNKYTIYSILPLIFIVSIVPLIVRLKIIQVPLIVQTLNGWDNVIGDFFSYHKSIIFLFLLILELTIFLYKYFYKHNISIKKSKLYYPMFLYLALVILSTIFSTYKEVAISGYPERYEGVYLHIGYILILFLAINMVDDEKHIKYILIALGISSIVLSIIGITQIIGKDFFATEFGQDIIIPNRYNNIVKGIDYIFTSTKTVYGTLYNTNYVGVYMSMIFALFTTFTILIKDFKFKVFSSIVSILSLINLFGSASRVGLVSLALYIMLLIILFRTTVIKRWRITVATLIILLISALGFNKYKDDFLKRRILSIKESIMMKTEESNLKDIKLNNNTATVCIDDYEINIIYGNGGFAFLDKDYQLIETNYNEDNGRFTFKEEPYNLHNFQLANYKDSIGLISTIRTNKGWAIFNLVLNSEGYFRILTPSGESIRFEKAPSWGFKGRERFASGRGFIWSRSIPLLKETILLGHGPDTFALYFPQDDYLSKLQNGMSVMTLVDKPHNMYLQIGINTGVISLLSVLFSFGIYVLSSLKTYLKIKEYNNFLEIAGLSIFLSICMYLFTGLFNDSVVSVAPVFWTLLGMGISINMKVKTEFQSK